jgi:hypothetical protein
MSDDACRWLDVLHAHRPGFIEIRPISKGRVLKPEFVPTEDCEQVVRRASELRTSADVYVGAAPRIRRSGKKDAVERLSAAWADIDTREAEVELLFFELPASMIVASGHGLHAYWLLEFGAEPRVGEQLNRGLARRLGSDPHVVDASRIMRIPGTLNHKSDPPTEVRLVDYQCIPYTAEALATALGVTIEREEGR